MVTIRQAIATDFPAWRDLRLRALREHPDSFGSSFADYAATPYEDAEQRFTGTSLASANTVFLAFDASGTLAGTTGIYRENGPKSQHRMGIWGVYVAAEARGQGIGTRLLQEAIAYSRTIDGVRQLELAVASHNLAAVRVYERAGFQQFGRLPRALLLDNQFIDEDLMILLLDEENA
jgi:RimJ/RimL family protein N-acetyltransferase